MKKEKVEEKVEKTEEKKVESKKQKALFTSRVLFISVLDKIYLVILGLYFLGGTFAIFSGKISNLNYGFWGRVGREIVFLIILFIVYLIMNWFYRCAAKTMICLTKNEVYLEKYVPFKRAEKSIPLNKITGVTTFNVFWIFRFLIIHQYHNIPLIFATWTNQEFKDRLNELITTDKEKVENEYESRNIITSNMYKYLAYVGIALVAIIALIGFVRFFAYVFNGERKLAGTYTYNENVIKLNKDGSCSIENLVDDVTDCDWKYDSEDKEVRLNYEYEYGTYYTYTRSGSMTLTYNSKEKSLDYEDMKFKK